MAKPAKNTTCLWFDRDAEDAARFYAATFPDPAAGAVHRARGDYPSGKQGDVPTVEFAVLGVPCLGLNGGPAFKHTVAFSFQVATAGQAETDRYWDAVVGNGGQESACGWCKDRRGLSWQVTPVALRFGRASPPSARRPGRAARRSRGSPPGSRPRTGGWCCGSRWRRTSCPRRPSRSGNPGPAG